MSIPGQIAASIRRQATDMLTTGERFKRFDQIRQRHFWSKYRMVPDANGYIPSGDYDFFQTTVGQKGQGFPYEMTGIETNWLGTNRVPDNQNLQITEFGVTCNVVANDAVAPGYTQSLEICNYNMAAGQLLSCLVLNLTYLTNSISLGLATDFAQASGPTGGFYAPSMPILYPALPPDTNNTASDDWREFVTNGFPGPSLRRKLKIPVLLQHGETFRMNMTIDQGRGPFMSPSVPNADYSNQPVAYDIRLDFWATESFVEKS